MTSIQGWSLPTQELSERSRLCVRIKYRARKCNHKKLSAKLGRESWMSDPAAASCIQHRWGLVYWQSQLLGRPNAPPPNFDSHPLEAKRLSTLSLGPPSLTRALHGTSKSVDAKYVEAEYCSSKSCGCQTCKILSRTGPIRCDTPW
jgi:hypothetical protein